MGRDTSHNPRALQAPEAFWERGTHLAQLNTHGISMEFPWNSRSFLSQGTATRFSTSAGSWERFSSWKPSPWTWRSGVAAFHFPLPWKPSDPWEWERPPAWPSSGSASAASAPSLLPGKNPTRIRDCLGFLGAVPFQRCPWGNWIAWKCFFGNFPAAPVLSTDGLGNASHPAVIHRESIKSSGFDP